MDFFDQESVCVRTSLTKMSPEEVNNMRMDEPVMVDRSLKEGVAANAKAQYVKYVRRIKMTE